MFVRVNHRSWVHILGVIYAPIIFIAGHFSFKIILFVKSNVFVCVLKCTFDNRIMLVIFYKMCCIRPW